MQRPPKQPRRDSSPTSSSSSDSDGNEIGARRGAQLDVGQTSFAGLATSSCGTGLLDVGTLRMTPSLLNVGIVPGEPAHYDAAMDNPETLNRCTTPLCDPVPALNQPGPSSCPDTLPVRHSCEGTDMHGNSVGTSMKQSKILDPLFIASDIPIQEMWGCDSHSDSDSDVCENRPFPQSSETSDSATEEESDSEDNAHIFFNQQSPWHEISESVEPCDESFDESVYVGHVPSAKAEELYSGCPITIQESLVSILSFSQSEKLSGAGLSRLLKLIEIHCPKPNNCLQSLEKITNHFMDVKTPIKSYFYCSECLSERMSITDVCDNCKHLGASIDQVLVLSLVDQVSKLYERPGFLHDIQYRFRRVKIHNDNLEDIYDGDVYHEAEENDLADSNNTSFMWGFDGFSPYDSVPKEVWPFFMFCNELPPEKRFKRENVVLAAVYVGQSKPHPNLFLKHVYDNVQLLNEAFLVNVPDMPEPLSVRACVICGTCDSPAKSLAFNQKYFNGFYSCPKCLSKGEKSEETDDVFVHPHEEDIILRTNTDYEESALEASIYNATASKTGKIAPHGIKGSTFLYLIVSNMILSTAIDTMHCVYLGCMQKCLDLWFDKAYKDEPWSLYKVKKVVNSLLMSICPPHFIKRMPRKLEQKAKFKAFESMLMLYYYLLPVLKTVMKQLYFHNFKLLVSGMSLLNKKSISSNDVNVGGRLLSQFSKDFQQLYGLRHMTFNIHLLRHMHEVVKALGPACFVSCFGLEDLNGKMCNLIHGSRFVGSQLYVGLFTFLHLPHLVNALSPGKVKDFCHSVSKKTKRVRIIEKLFDAIFSVGTYVKMDPVPEWINNCIKDLDFTNVFSFKRVLIHGIIISSEGYTRSKKHCSHFVKYISDNECYGLVKLFIKVSNCSCQTKCKCPGQFYALINKCNITIAFETANPPSEIKHILNYELSDKIELVPINVISNVCFHIKCAGSYLCDPINDVEMYN